MVVMVRQLESGACGRTTPHRFCALRSRQQILYPALHVGADDPGYGHGAQDHYEEVKEKLVWAVKQLKSGDPRQEDTFIGPLISQKEAQRVESWIADALSKGDPAPTKSPDRQEGKDEVQSLMCAI